MTLTIQQQIEALQALQTGIDAIRAAATENDEISAILSTMPTFCASGFEVRKFNKKTHDLETGYWVSFGCDIPQTQVTEKAGDTVYRRFADLLKERYGVSYVRGMGLFNFQTEENFVLFCETFDVTMV